MVFLTEAGYLRQPHTSAGRVPTEEGYRYFVRQLMGQTDLPVQTKRTITHQFYQAGHDVDQWMRLAASILAHQSQGASLVTGPHPEEARFKHLELIATLGRQVLMVLVLTGGEVRQQMLALAEPVSQEQLSKPAGTLNQHCQGLSSSGIASLSTQLDALEQDVLKLIVVIVGALGELVDPLLIDQNPVAHPDPLAHQPLQFLDNRFPIHENLLWVLHPFRSPHPFQGVFSLKNHLFLPYLAGRVSSQF